jgi:hypothetical protein
VAGARYFVRADLAAMFGGNESDASVRLDGQVEPRAGTRSVFFGEAGMLLPLTIT